MDEKVEGVTTEGGDAPQEDNAAPETPEEETPEESPQDESETPDEGDEDTKEVEDKTDRGTKVAKEPESRYYQQLKNENGDMRRLLGDPKALREYLREVEGTSTPHEEQQDDLRKIVEEATMDNGQVDAYKLSQLMEKRMLEKVERGMKDLGENMGRTQALNRAYDADKIEARKDHPEIDPKSDQYDQELETFVGERFIAQGGLEGKVTLKQVVDETFKWLEKARGSAKAEAEREVVKKRGGAITQQKVSGDATDDEANMTPEQVLAKRVQKQLTRRP